MIKLKILFILIPIIILKPQGLYESIFHPIDNGGKFGYNVILTDTILFISAHHDSSNGPLSGSVYFYKKVNNN